MVSSSRRTVQESLFLGHCITIAFTCSAAVEYYFIDPTLELEYKVPECLCVQ